MTMKNVEDFYPLSPMQQGMLFHSLYAPESGVYVEQVSCVLRGGLDVPAFERAWGRVVERHSILRAAFVGEGLKEPVQVVHRRVELPFKREDWRELPAAGQPLWAAEQPLRAAGQQARLEVFLEEERRRGFDLSAPPLMRLALMQIAADAHYFVWTYHHILLDGWSLPVLLQEVFAFYEAYRGGYDLRLDPPRPYRDYIAWLRRQSIPEAEAAWRRVLQGFSTPTPLAPGRPRDNAEDDEPGYDEEEAWLPAAATEALQRLAREHELTLNTLVQGAWALLLSRYSGEEDVLFGATVSGRPPALSGSESMVGLFINTLPVRVRIPVKGSALAWLKELQAQQAELRQYEYSPLIQVQGWSDVPRGTPLFDSILVFENYPINTALSAGEGSLAVEEVRSAEQTNFPITVVAGAAERLMLKMVYDIRRFDRAAVRRMIGHLVTLVEELAVRPERPLWAVPILSGAEERQILKEWNATHCDYPRLRSVAELFAAQAAWTPDSVAVTFEGQHLTYGELNQQGNQLAHHLAHLGVGPETLVAVCLERSPRMILALLGVLKAGGAYVPLDPALPGERLAYILQDSRAAVLLTQASLVERLASPGGAAPSVVCLDADWKRIAGESDSDPCVQIALDNLAYAIYTSGSTGQPKGTLLRHEGLNNLIHALTSIFAVDRRSRVLQFASLGFDASVAEIFMSLLSGATLGLARLETLMSPQDLAHILREESITTVTLPPAMLRLLQPDEFPALGTVASAGEACPPEVAYSWASGPRFLNGYGPTETTVAASFCRVDGTHEAARGVPIGRPVPNTQIYLLDRHLRPLPVGVPGELHVGGIGLARGYLNRPQLTAERFIPNPFGDEPGCRLYKTGDLARYLPDGCIEFLGRIDHQVKLRGFRVELGEIEAALSAHPGVQVAVVTAPEVGPAGERRLVAYLVPEGDSAPAVSELRGFLEKTLPDYMIPSLFVMLQSLPLTSSGKVDRRALPAPDNTRPELQKVYVAPRDGLEAELVQIWEEVLDVHPIGVKDNFFDLGGHSLSAVRLMSQIHKRFDVDVSLVSLFQEPTVEQSARAIRYRREEVVHASLVPLQPHGSKHPLFFVHPSGGSVHWYVDLAHHLGADQPLYGLQAQGINGDHQLHSRVEDMAAHYVKAIRAVQPEGPYLLGSWSMGVAIAYEMAQQLVAQGQEVGLLAMLDQGPFLPAEVPEDQASHLMETFGKHLPLSLDHLRQLGPDEQIAYVWEEARKAEWIYPDVTLPKFRHFVHILRTHTEAWRHYQPRIYPGRITLLRAVDEPRDNVDAADLGWGKLGAGGVEIYEVPGDHLSMIHEPHVQTLAAQLRACLEAVTNK